MEFLNWFNRLSFGWQLALVALVVSVVMAIYFIGYVSYMEGKWK